MLNFISIEGGEGSGKTTQIKLLEKWFSEKQIPCIFSREPGATRVAEDIRALLLQGSIDRWTPKEELLLYNLARHNTLRLVIKPALKQGKFVVSDRYYDSTLVYQGHVQGVPTEALDAIHRTVNDDIRPSLTFYLDIDPEVGLKRTQNEMRFDTAHESRFENKGLSFHEKVRAGYLKIASQDEDRIVVIDANKSIEEIHEIMTSTIVNRYAELKEKVA